MTDDHDGGLPHDLNAILSRRAALGLFLSTTAGLAACDRLPFLSHAEAEVAATGPDGVTCVADPTETAGPYPADGSNRAHGTLANVLKDSGIVRHDMRTDLTGSATSAVGTEVLLTISLVAVGPSCTPLSGHAIYLWHCDAAGQYSIYGLPERSYLRAVGVTDIKGEVAFRTILPGCYDGRAPHMHFEIYRDLASASDYRNRLLTSQLAMPGEACLAVYRSNPVYQKSLENFALSPLDRDMVFSDNTKGQLAQQTPVLDVQSDGSYRGRVTIGMAET